MGQYGNVSVIYGFLLTEEEMDEFNEDFEIDDWCEKNGLDYDFGGTVDWSENDQNWVVGVKIGKDFSNFGAFQLPDGYATVKYEHYRKVAPFVHKFGREPKRFLVFSYG